jgi:DNA-binding MarR family transcriptional regulator
MSLQHNTAGILLKVVPRVMRTVRTDMRSFRDHSLSVPQFRTLGFIHRNSGTSLSQAAEHIGLTLPAMSRLVEGLVNRQLLVRQRHPDDRRRITLDLTARGHSIWVSAREFTQVSLSGKLSALSPKEHATISHAMTILGRIFARDSLRGNTE